MACDLSLEDLQNAADNETATILLSTYNGAKYLEQQLSSFDQQTYTPLHVIVRDDGSSDETAIILKAWSQRSPLKSALVMGQNLGARDSFFQLLKWAPERGAVFLSDQDDIWHHDKVARAVDRVRGEGIDLPTLYCSRLNLIDDDLQPVGKSPLWRRPASFENALVENVATGCTCALNGAAVDVFRNMPEMQYAIMHDWWIYLAISALGRVIYDAEPSIDYRVHSNNVVGLPTNRMSWTVSKIRRQSAASIVPKIVRQAEEFERIFAERLSSAQLESIRTLTNCRSLSGAFNFVRQSRLRRQLPSDDLALKAMVALAALKG